MKIEVNVDGRAVGAVLALTLLLGCTTVVNAWVYPGLIEVLPVAREIWSGCSVAAILLVALAANVRPALLAPRRAVPASAAATVAGPLLAWLGVELAAPALVGLGSVLAGLGDAWFAAAVGVALACLGTGRCKVVIPAALVLNGLIGLATAALHPALLAACLLYGVANMATYILVRPLVTPELNLICSSDSPSPSELSPTNPFSFLPVTHPLLVCVLVFAATYGLVLSSFQKIPVDDLAPFQALPGLVTLAALGAAGSLKRKGQRRAGGRSEQESAIARDERHRDARMGAADTPYPTDLLFRASAFLLLAGILFFPLSLSATGIQQALSPVLLSMAYGCYELLAWYLIAGLGERNRTGALTFSATVVGLSWLGIALGANVGTLLGQALPAGTDAPMTACAVMGLLAVLYFFVALREFSFERSVLTVEPALPVSGGNAEGGQAGEDAFAERCAQVARSFSLTSRETEIFELLARGRSAPVIQERLTLSHNTIKTHVRHIYEKTGIHSQQGIIDLMEKEGR